MTFDVAGQSLDVTAAVLLFAAGRRPNSDTLHVEAAGITVDARGRVLTNAYMETSVPGIYAFGDLTSPYQLKHIANAEARHITKQLLGQVKMPISYDGVRMPSLATWKWPASGSPSAILGNKASGI